MRKILLSVMFILTTIIFTGCSSNKDSIKLKSDEKFVKYIENEIGEPIEYIEKTVDEKYEKEYKFLITNKNLEFTAFQCVSDSSFGIDGDVFWHTYSYGTGYDYTRVIIEANQENFKALAEQYNVDLNNEGIILYNLDTDTLENLYNFLIDVEKTCDLKLNSRQLEENQNYFYFTAYLENEDKSSTYMGHLPFAKFSKYFPTKEDFKETMTKWAKPTFGNR